jgi:hypothetical protein
MARHYTEQITIDRVKSALSKPTFVFKNRVINWADNTVIPEDPILKSSERRFQVTLRSLHQSQASRERFLIRLLDMMAIMILNQIEPRKKLPRNCLNHAWCLQIMARS